MKAKVTLVEGQTWLGQAGSGHGIVLDASPDIGGQNLGCRPMELMLLGLAGCTAIDVRLILQRGREAVTDCVIEAEAERAPSDPKVFTKVHLTFRVTGRTLSRAKVERAVALSHEKYCSATAMFLKTAEITHTIEVLEAGDATEAA